MAKTDVPNDTQTKQTPEEWAVRRAILSMNPDWEPRQVWVAYDLYRNNQITVEGKREAIESVALSFMQLREECAAVADNSPAWMTQTVIATNIRNLHTNG